VALRSLLIMYMARPQSDTPLAIASNSQATNHYIPIFHVLSLLFCSVLFCFVKSRKKRCLYTHTHTHTLSLSLSSLSPLTTRHKSSFVLCNPWYCFLTF
jgi:Na+/melibiose symporter-like transporter